MNPYHSPIIGRVPQPKPDSTASTAIFLHLFLHIFMRKLVSPTRALRSGRACSVLGGESYPPAANAAQLVGIAASTGATVPMCAALGSQALPPGM